MEYWTLIIFLAIITIIVAIVYDINVKDLKQLNKKQEEKLDGLTKDYPSNLEICKYILKKLKNSSVKIEEDKNMNVCLYIAITNKILIGNLKQSYTRIQTIAHECIHSVQNRKILIFNFIFSNIYIIYFIIISILVVLKMLPYKSLFLIIMLILSYVYFFVRSYLETDAMIKAKFLAKEYMEEVRISNSQDIEKIINSYDELNNIGIKYVNYDLFFKTILKTMFITFLFIICK